MTFLSSSGTIRFRTTTHKPTGGHNGIDSIDKSIGKEYSRVRIGIGHPKDKKKVNSHVLEDFNENEEENSNGALILDILADKDVNETKEEKYIPPKTRQHLSPSVRKIVEEKNIDISSIQGTGKAGRISKGDLISLMGDIPQTSKSVLMGIVHKLKGV